MDIGKKVVEGAVKVGKTAAMATPQGQAVKAGVEIGQKVINSAGKVMNNMNNQKQNKNNNKN